MSCKWFLYESNLDTVDWNHVSNVNGLVRKLGICPLWPSDNVESEV